MTDHYIGTKRVTAWPQEKDGRPGYAVKYADGYISWSPKDVFEGAYRLEADRVTVEAMQERICCVSYYRIGATVTLCHIVLDNGYSVRGESACVNPANFDKELGEKYAYEDAFKKLWPLFGFALAEDRFRVGLVQKVCGSAN